MKYIDAEKLIKAIEEKGLDCSFALKMERLDTLALIDELQQEQPEMDLEKEIEDWCDKNITGVRPIYTADSLIYGLLPKTAHHFYKLGLNTRKEE